MAVDVAKSLKSEGSIIWPGLDRLTFDSIWLYVDASMSQIYK
jgi:hypothetical protein